MHGLPGPASPSPMGAVPRWHPAEAGDEPRRPEHCHGALRERFGEVPNLCPLPSRPLARGLCAAGPWKPLEGAGSPCCRAGLCHPQMYAYASSVFREAGVPQEKVQYAIIGTGCCELFTAFVSVSLALGCSSPSPGEEGGPGVLTP